MRIVVDVDLYGFETIYANRWIGILPALRQAVTSQNNKRQSQK